MTWYNELITNYIKFKNNYRYFVFNHLFTSKLYFY